MNPSHSITLRMYMGTKNIGTVILYKWPLCTRDFDFPNFAKTIYTHTHIHARTHQPTRTLGLLRNIQSYYVQFRIVPHHCHNEHNAHMHNLGLAFEQVIGLPA